MSGYISLHRKLLDWEWYNDNNTKILFIHCLLKANWEDKNWQGTLIKRGSFITSIETLSNELNLTFQNIRTSLSKLEKTNEIVKNSTNKNTLLTIVKYDDYQNLENKVTNEQQTNNKQLTTTNNIIIKKENIDPINWSVLLDFFNEITGKKCKVVPEKAKSQFKARLKENFTKEDIANAIQNAYNDKYHKETNHQYLTLEFISRADKLERFSTQKT
jgi:uncharacterized phage protein (TIGR02220 family)